MTAVNWTTPARPPEIEKIVQVLCRVLPDEQVEPRRSAHCGVSTGDHAEGDLFVSIGYLPSEAFTAEQWLVAGRPMSQGCWTNARRFEVVGWFPLAVAT